MAIYLRKCKNFKIIDISEEEFNLLVAKKLRKIFKNLIINHEVNIIINLSQVISLNLAALGCILSAHRICKNKGGRIDIYGPQPDVLLLFYIIQLDKYINIYNCESDALMCRNMHVKRRFKVIKASG